MKKKKLNKGPSNIKPCYILKRLSMALVDARINRDYWLPIFKETQENFPFLHSLKRKEPRIQIVYLSTRWYFIRRRINTLIWGQLSLLGGWFY